MKPASSNNSASGETDENLDFAPTLRPAAPSSTSSPRLPQTENDLDFGPTMRGLREGLKMFERYTLVRMLGRGGMGVVWQAHDEKLELDIAMKFLHENLVGDDAALDDLRRETRRCMKLHHTNIVQVYDLVDDPGSAAIAMEFIDGRPFSALRMDKPSRVMDAEDLLPLLEQVCAALSYAHETARIVHHDLKPGNLMLTRDGIVKVMDFGIASSLNDSMSRNSRAGQQSSSGSGTLPYMSPQQLMGFPPSVADDVYSLGATLYELLSSKPPFFRGELTRQIESITPPTIRERRVELEIEGAAPVPEVWEQTIAACLDKEAEKRPQSVRGLMARLNGQMAAPSTPDRASAAPPASTRTSRTPTLIALAAMLCIGGVLGWWFGFEAPKRAEAANIEQQRQQQEAAHKAQELADADVAARLVQEKEDAARIAKEQADKEEKQRQMAAQAEAARMAKEKAEAEEKARQMAAQLVLKRQEADKLVAAAQILVRDRNFDAAKEKLAAALYLIPGDPAATKLQSDVNEAIKQERDRAVQAAAAEAMKMASAKVTSDTPPTSAPSNPPQTSLLEAPRLPPSGFFDLDTLFSSSQYAARDDYSKGQILKKAQEKLKTFGFYPSTPDGTPGPTTQRAIIDWERARALQQTGRLGDANLAELGLKDLPQMKAPKIAQSPPARPRTKPVTPAPVARQPTPTPQAAPKTGGRDMSYDEFIRRSKELERR